MKPRVPMVACVLALCALLNCGNPAVATKASPSDSQLVRLPPEVRLRKLHLVRPDLIQYPISFEVYC